MASVIQVPNLRTGYVDVCRKVLACGRRVAPRGQMTSEMRDVIIEVMDPTDVLPLGVGRKLNSAIAAAEALQLIGGFSVPQLMVDISSNFEQFMDDGRFHGAYGERVRSGLNPGAPHQAEAVIERLTLDPNSRQAVIVLWRPELDLQPGKHDYPCTLSLTFSLNQHGALDLSVVMRSNDVWWGLAYDAFQFTQLQITLASVLGAGVGRYTHHAISLHAYERDFASIEQLTYPTQAQPAHRVIGVANAWHDDPTMTRWRGVELSARELGAGAELDPATNEVIRSLNPWYDNQLAPYLIGRMSATDPALQTLPPKQTDA